MTSDEMQRYLERLAMLPDNPDLPEDEPPSAVATQIRVDVVGGQPRRLRRVHTNGLGWAGLPELFIDPPASYRPGEEQDWATLAFLIACALVTLGMGLAEVEDHLEVEPYQDVFRGRPVRLWLAQYEAPDEDLARALRTSSDKVIRVECSLWSDEPDENAKVLFPPGSGPIGSGAALSEPAGEVAIDAGPGEPGLVGAGLVGAGLAGTGLVDAVTDETSQDHPGLNLNRACA
ncbi:hypothetical protein [Kineosporia babensis]|uniref:Uncharacterized protein n=1 Tax=Kineosporia babensis TaxID=499548 RepID=A0A9X1NBW6_9ACTN|nr:hypothetical protein [Kineosporia babensis]MCD5310218.1 hypothetical protein [Kineosporia babensis]